MSGDEEMVMRSVYLWLSDDGRLRQLAHDLNVSKSDLIRAAIGVKLMEWLGDRGRERVQWDLQFGRREGLARPGMPGKPSGIAPTTHHLVETNDPDRKAMTGSAAFDPKQTPAEDGHPMPAVAYGGRQDMAEV